MIDSISERNPHLDEMRERGWAWIATNSYGKYGAPHTDDEYAAQQVERYHQDEETDWEDPEEIRFSQQELRIITWEEDGE